MLVDVGPHLWKPFEPAPFPFANVDSEFVAAFEDVLHEPARSLSAPYEHVSLRLPAMNIGKGDAGMSGAVLLDYVQ